MKPEEQLNNKLNELGGRVRLSRRLKGMTAVSFVLLIEVIIFASSIDKNSL